MKIKGGLSTATASAQILAQATQTKQVVWVRAGFFYVLALGEPPPEGAGRVVEYDYKPNPL